ncbi:MULTISPECIES: putative bifunctional diguanylate cyclase/phosphodiesterase [Corallincola]|uniref:Bifunctional diguanylate cyclase/phosphodiesterase n=2 Tax=Corallincola TaxID=1775176 RepID=A0A368NQ96_9GAMM|nr:MULTISPECIES: bifunctional diguanylate cyclase/phosphodiesterase [Corallincola]RCU51649.1 bifunctional diguanylate cyclase/phosphodiesterase [Corallincola holothuriorum]TAA47150.1 bifunctional diguanylate cyclase/phosphodiesterase [Corallincola spongiicola]
MQRRFISIRWQFSVGLVFLLTVLVVSLHLLSISRMEDQLETQLVNSNIAQQKTFLTLSEMMGDRLIEFSDIVLGEPDLDMLSTDQGKQLLLQAVDDYWAANQLIWRLESAWLFGANREQWGSWGDVSQPPPWIWLEEIMVKVDYVSRIGCAQRCVYYIGVPVNLGKQGIGALVVSLSLMDLVIALRHSHRIDVAIVTQRQATAQDQLPYLNGWNVGISSLSSKDRFLPILEETAAKVPLDRLFEGGITAVAEDNIRLSAVKISDKVAHLNDGYLILIDDISEQKAEIERFRDNSVLLSAMVMLGGLLLGLIPISHVVARTNVLAKMMPMVAEQKFEQVRALLTRRLRLYRDEFTVLESAAETLNEQLESLGHKVEKRTHQLERMAMYDELTGLPNRHLLLQTLRDDVLNIGTDYQQLAVVLIDLDEFKRINDTLGHDAGDELLKDIAQRLQRFEHLARETVFLGRFGDDEFTLLLKLQDDEQLTRQLQQIREVIREPVNLRNETLVINGSLGIALADSGQLTAEELMRQADTALYQAKSNGKNQYRFFDPVMAADAYKRLAMESELRRAVQEKEFCLFLQPQIALTGRKLVGFEALIRWRHPEKGLVFPDEFIPQLENSEHIVAVGYWTIEHSMAILQQLKLQGLPDIKIAINLTSHQFDDEKLGAFISDNLARYGLKEAQIELELTENTLIGDIDKVLTQMQELRKRGVSLAIDDFGTGYSSLEYLRRLPVNILKIDRSFVMDLDNDETDRQLVQTILAMAKNMHMDVVAEGIEKHSHIDFLAERGCGYGQGYFICRPIDELQLMIAIDKHLIDGRWLG